MRRQRSLNRQLLALGTAPAIVMFLVLLLFFTSVRLDDARRDLFNNTQVIADSLAPAVEYAVISGNDQALQQILDRTLMRSGVAWIQVSDLNGNIVGVGDRAGDDGSPEREGHHIFNAGILQQPLATEFNYEDDWMAFGLSGSNAALWIGEVEVAVSGDSLADQRQEIILSSLAVALSVLLVTLLVVSHLAQRISRPIQRLSANVKKLKERHYEPAETTQGAAVEITDLEQNLAGLALHLAQLRESRDQTLALKESARADAVAANTAKSQFLATMSHELRTPLNGITGMLELVRDEPLTPRQQDYIATARESTDDLLAVISDILDFSRIREGELVLSARPFDLHHLIRNCMASYRHECLSKGVDLQLELNDEWPEDASVKGDAARLRQILAHLLDNAIKFTEEGRITVRCEWQVAAAQSVYLTCEVCDSGAGIAPQYLGRIFNSFEQLDGSQSRLHGGTGIGLTLVQGLVELMGGHVRVESDVGQGSLFFFELPLERVTAERTTEEVGAGQHASAGQSEVENTYRTSTSKSTRAPLALVVEDNEVNQRVAMALLKRLGFETVGAENGELAVTLITQGQYKYDLVLMDCQMPVMDGYEATRRIRAWETVNSDPPLPIIALTADALPGTDPACRKAGMDDYIAKPIRKDRLGHVLERWFRGSLT